MREIKFRAFDKSRNKMIYDIQDEYEGAYTIHNYFGEILKSNNYEVMQYTGIKDKNGIEIYEGDIVKIDEVLDIKNFITDIYFGEQAFRYRHSDNSGSVLPNYTKKIKGYESVITEIEIIGNIYENKELLKEE